MFQWFLYSLSHLASICTQFPCFTPFGLPVLRRQATGDRSANAEGGRHRDFPVQSHAQETREEKCPHVGNQRRSKAQTHKQFHRGCASLRRGHASWERAQHCEWPLDDPPYRHSPGILILWPLSVFQYMNNLDKWGLDMFKIAQLSNNRPLTCVTYTILQVSLWSWFLWCVRFSRGIFPLRSENYAKHSRFLPTLWWRTSCIWKTITAVTSLTTTTFTQPMSPNPPMFFFVCQRSRSVDLHAFCALELGHTCSLKPHLKRWEVRNGDLHFLRKKNRLKINNERVAEHRKKMNHDVLKHLLVASILGVYFCLEWLTVLRPTFLLL